jgi:hypothetical protein
MQDYLHGSLNRIYANDLAAPGPRRFLRVVGGLGCVAVNLDARIMPFRGGARPRAEWLAVRLDDLDHGDIDGICAAARAHPSSASRKTKWTKLWASSRTTRRACATSGSAPAACSPAPMPSPPCAAAKPAASGKHLQCTAQPDMCRLNRRYPKMIFSPYKIGAHPPLRAVTGEPRHR